MKTLPRLPDDEFLVARYSFDTFQPIIKHKQLRMVKTGTWLGGLLNNYKLMYTDWITEKSTK